MNIPATLKIYNKFTNNINIFTFSPTSNYIDQRYMCKDFKIYEFSSGEELLEEFEKHCLVFDLLFLDNKMKKLTGLETAGQIRQSKSTSARSIVFVTSSDDHNQITQVRPLQVVCKPCTQVHIGAILEKVNLKDLYRNTSPITIKG